MKAFISYSHQDTHMLDVLHKHLIQLKRDGIIETWTDQDILAGENLDFKINSALEDSGLFIALISPDYILSNYCYEKEFKYALERQNKGNLVIVPIIIESCDWQSTPFSKFKAIPKDGKPISTWENKNTAMLDVIQNLRKLILETLSYDFAESEPKSSQNVVSRNYRIKKDFDSIEKMDFLELTFQEIKTYLKRYLDEVLQLDNIKARILSDTANTFECILVNRNKIATESKLQVTSLESAMSNQMFSRFGSEEKQITIAINGKPTGIQFALQFDDFHLYWKKADFYNVDRQKEYNSKEISEEIWNVLLESVGIL